MVDYARFQRYVVDDNGDIVASPTVEVRDQVTNALATIYTNRDGSTALANPFTGTAEGLAAFHVAGGSYKITATSGAFSAEWTWVGIGTAQEYDFTDVQDYVDTQIANATIGLRVDNGASVISTGIQGNIVVPFNCEILEYTLLANESGSIVIDVWKDTYANYPPTDADSITASAPMTISSSTKGQDSTLTGWTVALSAGDILRFNVDSVTNIKAVDINILIART